MHWEHPLGVPIVWSPNIITPIHWLMARMPSSTFLRRHPYTGERAICSSDFSAFTKWQHQPFCCGFSGLIFRLFFCWASSFALQTPPWNKFPPEAEASVQRDMLCGGSGCYSIASSLLISLFLRVKSHFSEVGLQDAGPAHSSFGAGRHDLPHRSTEFVTGWGKLFRWLTRCVVFTSQRLGTLWGFLSSSL